MRADLSTDTALQGIIPDFLRSLERPQAIPYKSALLRGIREREVVTNSGLIVGRELVLGIDGQRLARVVRRTVRGLFFLNCDRILPVECPISVWESAAAAQHELAAGALSVVGTTVIQSGHGEDIADVFRYRFLPIEDELDGSWWVLSFFTKVIYFARTGRMHGEVPVTN
jgi:hypothetical protein